MVKIRLSQTGSRNRRMFRIIAIEDSKRRNGKPVEFLGFYNPKVTPVQLKIDQERITYWQSKGAIISDGVAKLLSKTP